MELTISVVVESCFCGTKTYVLNKISSGSNAPTYQIAYYKNIDCLDDDAESESVHEVDAESVENMFKILSETSLPILTEFMSGCDGVTYSIEIVNGMNSVTYSWWLELPKEWKALECVLNVFFGEDGLPD